MAANELKVSSMNHEDLKVSLIDFLRASGKFDDFNFEGSTLNTIIDLLVRNTMFDAFLANMLANESFISSAQIRGNVSSHAQKLSYVPRSSTAARIICDIEVTPNAIENLDTSIVMETGKAFLSNIGGSTYTFTNKEPYVLNFNQTTNKYIVRNVELFQGQYVTNNFVHEAGTKIVIPNLNCDSSTLSVVSDESIGETQTRVYTKADSVSQFAGDENLFFVGEDTRGRIFVEFGKDVLGSEPASGSLITVAYIGTEEEHANGVKSLIAASTIAGYANISISVTTNSFGGAEREDIESIRFIAPKYYEIQDRAVSDVDYAILLKANFPFIRSVISWGGEVNDPPRYGDVLISIISDDGGILTNSIKNQMTNFLSSKNVGSVTPVILEPEFFGIDLVVNFAYDQRNTNKTFAGVRSDVDQKVAEYKETLNDFDVFYNEAELIKRVMSVRSLTSVDIDKTVFFDINVLRFVNPVYRINFDNELEEGSLSMDGFIVASNGTGHRLYDSNGIVNIEYFVNGQRTLLNVGTIDYETGVVEFITNFIQDANTLRLYVRSSQENFYVEANKVAYINDVDIELLNTRSRNSVLN